MTTQKMPEEKIRKDQEEGATRRLGISGMGHHGL
jgi:hypothetical protein